MIVEGPPLKQVLYYKQLLDEVFCDIQNNQGGVFYIICSYDVTGADFENSLYAFRDAFGQSEKS